MFKIWIDCKSKYWRARYCDVHGVERNYTLQFPVTDPREEVLSEVACEAARCYVHFLNSSNTWKLLALRNYDIKRMYKRLRDFSEYYTIEEFAAELQGLGVTPAEPREAAIRKTRERRAVKRRRRWDKLFEYNGKKMNINAWANASGISVDTLCKRIDRGWNFGEAISTPVLSKNQSGMIGAERRWKGKGTDDDGKEAA